MAYKKLALFLFAILLAITATTIANAGLLYRGVNVVGCRVRGRAVCSLSPNPQSTAPGIGGVKVDITCNGGSTSLAEAITNSDGFFDTIVTTLDGLSFDQSSLPCYATINLPVGINCSVFPPKATIRATVHVVGTITQTVIGFLVDTVTSVFTLVHN